MNTAPRPASTVPNTLHITMPGRSAAWLILAPLAIPVVMIGWLVAYWLGGQW